MVIYFDVEYGSTDGAISAIHMMLSEGKKEKKNNGSGYGPKIDVGVFIRGPQLPKLSSPS
jgi:hypothetical protein